MHITEAIKKLVDNQSLCRDEAYMVCLEIMEGNATPAQIGSLLTALRMKGETTDEITGFAQAMREKMVHLDCAVDHIVDTCGTGGDVVGTFNISTTSAFIAAGAGCCVAKHGNRSVSSLCGSADLIEALEIRTDLEPEFIRICIENIGIGFLFAPLFHPAMKFAIGPRKEMGIRTIFNLVGPLCNPASVQRQVIGVCKKEFMDKIAGTLKNLGVHHCLVVHGADGMDEMTITDKTYVYEIKDGVSTEYEISPEEFGIDRCRIEELKVRTTEESLNAIAQVLHGVPGPKTDVAVLNAAAVIYVSGKAKSIENGIALARESVLTGSALKKLEGLKRYTNGFSKRNNQ